MILCVAERAHCPDMRAWEVSRFREHWSVPRERIRFIMALQAVSRGSTRARAKSQLGLPVDACKFVNLLWPDSGIGTWDAKAAADAAVTLMEYLATEEGAKYKRAVLLGRRVAAAFRLPDDAVWGSRWGIGPGGSFGAWTCHPFGPVMVLPHPSGRSRVTNDEHERESIRGAVARLVSEVYT